MLAPVSISLAWRKILEQGGVLNQILNIDFSWLSSVQLAIWIVIFVSIWQWMGYNLLILYAGLQSLDIQMLEAADMDGASWTRKIFEVVIPSIVPTIVLNVVINVISAFRVFDIVYVLTRGGPVHNSEVLTTLMYYYSFSANGPNKMGVGSAIAMVRSWSWSLSGSSGRAGCEEGAAVDQEVPTGGRRLRHRAQAGQGLLHPFRALP